MYTAKQVEGAIKETLAQCRVNVVQSWSTETDREKRERLWSEYQAIERVEESLRNDFGNIIERAAGPVDQPGR
jgi:methionyl-tRNA synthetase